MKAHEISVTPSTLTTIGSTATSLANMADHSNTHAIYSSNVSNSLFNQTTPPPQNFTELLNSHQNYTLPSQSPNPYHHTRVLTNGTIAPHNQTNTSQTPVVGAVALAAVALGTIIRRSMRSTAPTTKGTGSAPKKEKPHTLG